VIAAIRELDDGRESIAEVCRRVGAVAATLALPRPSYVHVRRLVRRNRAHADARRTRRTALRGIAADVATDLAVGRFVHAYELAARVRRAGRAVGRSSWL